jgi:GNAT superfamily N-acetyltransferase
MGESHDVKNGYVQLPPGKLANAVLWLEMRDPVPVGLPAPKDSQIKEVRLQELGREDAALFGALYRQIGRDWLWAGLISKSESDIAERLGRDDVLSFAVWASNEAIAMLDMEITADGCEIVYFGFIPAMIARGAGPWLMDQAKRIAHERSIGRLWLHTCNFDHPRAAGFYRRQGFQIYATGYEIMDDPRLLGLLPRDAAGHVPLLRHTS